MTERSDMPIGEEATGNNIIPTGPPSTYSNADNPEDTPQKYNTCTPPAQTATEAVLSATNNATDVPSSTDVELSPGPLVHRRASGRDRKDEADDLISLLKAQIVQDGIRRNEEYQRREQERNDRERERREERDIRAEEARRHENMMQMMMMVICKGRGDDKAGMHKENR